MEPSGRPIRSIVTSPLKGIRDLPGFLSFFFFFLLLDCDVSGFAQSHTPTLIHSALVHRPTAG